MYGLPYYERGIRAMYSKVTPYKRMILLFICHNWEFFVGYDTFIDALKGMYGWAGGDQGPFSLQSCLAYHFRPNTWADELIIMALSIMWQLKIIIVTGHDRKCSRVRLKGTLKQACMIFLHTGNKHFSTISKLLGDE